MKPSVLLRFINSLLCLVIRNVIAKKTEYNEVFEANFLSISDYFTMETSFVIRNVFIKVN